MFKVAVPIVNRTNYTKIKPVLMKIKTLEIKIILSSSIILNQYGNAYLDIIDDGHINPIYIDCLLANDTHESMIKTMGISLIEHSSVYKQEKPDALLVVGDRFDMVPAVLAGKVMNIPIYHIQGGERSGSIDDTLRDLISICSTRHYAATAIAAERIKKITGSPNVFQSGCPAVEYISNLPVGSFLDVSTLGKKYKDPIPIKPMEPYLLISVHPNTVEKDDISINQIISACLSFKMKRILIYPNNDAFHSIILDAVRRYKNEFITIKHCPVHDFVKLMAHASCMIGNSSAGIREAASFGTPVVNIGSRQKNRDRNKNTIDSSCNYNDIVNSIIKSINAKKYNPENIYLKPLAAEFIANDIEKDLTIHE